MHVADSEHTDAADHLPVARQLAPVGVDGEPRLVARVPCSRTSKRGLGVDIPKAQHSPKTEVTLPSLTHRLRSLTHQARSEARQGPDVSTTILYLGL